MPTKTSTVKTGLDILVEKKMKPLKGLKVALLGHPASVDQKLVHLLDHCLNYGVQVKRLFGPEHGFLGNAQDMESVTKKKDKKTGLPVVSLYGKTKESLHINLKDLKGIDVLVCDLQDIGSRYYTFAYTLAFAQKTCATAGVEFMVLDRPNPLGGQILEGNTVKDKFTSFVGEYPILNRHGMTMGELVQYFSEFDKVTNKPKVVWMKNWKRSMLFKETKLPWVFPSPNMPTEVTALIYPGGCLFEGTNLSEGRGTTKPFELIGAPYITDPQSFVSEVTNTKLPGVHFRPCWFTPQFQKHALKLCGGLQIHVENPQTFKPLKTAIAILNAAKKQRGFDWRREPYEFVSDRLAIDLLFGDDKPRKLLEANKPVDEVMNYIKSSKKPFEKIRTRFLNKSY